MDLLIFEVAGHRYGLRQEAVQELAQAVAVVPLPKAPAVIEGVVNFRGRVVPVLDLRARFGLAPKPAEPSDHLILAKAGPRLAAIRADRAVRLARVEDAQIESAREVSPRAEYVSGIVKLPDGLVLIHDLGTFLSRAESAKLAESLSSYQPGKE